MKLLAQLNAEIESAELLRVKRDVLGCGTSLRNYVSAALIHFRQSQTIEQRRLKFKGKQKVYGRSISVGDAK